MPKITANDLSTALLLHRTGGRAELLAWLDAADPTELADLLLEREIDEDGEERGFPLQFALLNSTHSGTEIFKLLFDRIPRDKLIYALTEPFNGGRMGVKSMVDAYIPYAERNSEYKECFAYIETRLQNEIEKSDCPAEFRKEANEIIGKIVLYIHPELLPDSIRTIRKAGFTLQSAFAASPWAFKTSVTSHADKFFDSNGNNIESPASRETMLGAISGTLDPAKIAKQRRTKDEFTWLMMPSSRVPFETLRRELDGIEESAYASDRLRALFPGSAVPEMGWLKEREELFLKEREELSERERQLMREHVVLHLAISYNQARDSCIGISLFINRDNPSGPALCDKLKAWLEANDLWLTDNPECEAEDLFNELGLLDVYVPLGNVAKLSAFLEELKSLKALPELAEIVSRRVIDAINIRNTHGVVATAAAAAGGGGGGAAAAAAAAGGAGASGDDDKPTFTP